MRLIDADRFEAFCYDVPMDVDADSFMRGVEFVLDKIDAASTILAVFEVVDPKDPNIIRCKDCKHYKQSAIADRKMCFRKDIDGFSVCYEFEPNDWCCYAERKEK